MAYYLTLDEEKNRFEFVCPIFDVKTKMAHCSQIRESVYAGRTLPVRKGCQACVRSSKCPAAEIIRKISFGGGNVPDDYGSRQSVVGKIRKDVLTKIHRVMVMETTLNQFGVPDAERQLIASSSERIGKMIGAAPLPSDNGPQRRSAFEESSAKSSPRKSRSKAKPANDEKEKSNAVNEAAASGDLAAAVNA